MQSKFRKISRALLLSAFTAVATPAIAAGLVAGTAGAVRVVADAGPLPNRATVDVSATTDVSPDGFAATDGPRRLSALAGSDEQAWASARDVHVRAVARKR